VLVGLVIFTGVLLLAVAGYAFVYRDERMIIEILGFVLMFLSGVGGWAIGRSSHNNSDENQRY
jgi:ABC-type polysaccharide/polyol phosphate export permease